MEYDKDRFYGAGLYKKTELMHFLKEQPEDTVLIKDIKPEPWRASYLENIATNLFKFENIEVDTKDIKEKL